MPIPRPAPETERWHEVIIGLPEGRWIQVDPMKDLWQFHKATEFYRHGRPPQAIVKTFDAGA
jgi:hypothetical protein